MFAAALPIVSAVLGVFTGLGLLGTAAAAISFGTVSPTLAIMMGLGVGIDYGLFLITRHRQQVISGRDPRDAAASTVATSGRAVLIAGSTVVIAMLGLYASGVAFIGALGLAAAIAVAVSAVAAVTLVPALLSLAGTRIDRIAVRTPVAESSSDGTDGGWGRYAERIGAHPWRYLTAGAGLLIVLAIPVLSMTLGHVDAGADPQNYTDKRSYDAISSAFGPGTNGPLTVVVELPQGGSAGSLPQTLQTALSGTADVASVTPVTASPDGALLTTTVIPASSPQDAKTDALLHTLRDTTLPDALSGTGAHGYVTGTTAGQLDFRDIVSARLPIIIAVVIAAAFLLLLASFRSPFLAIKAALLNLLSIGAAYGVVVAVFQWGWGSSALGVSEKVPVESYVPMMMFAIVFGLSMDYEVFLLARVRETWVATKDNHRAVAHGLAATARVISCAAVIMTSVFLAFLLSTNVVIKMLALGLGVSVLVDATIIRLLVVPATMYLAARANWWIPGWLDRILPHLDPEGHPDAGATAEPPAADAPAADDDDSSRRRPSRRRGAGAQLLGAGALPRLRQRASMGQPQQPRKRRHHKHHGKHRDDAEGRPSWRAVRRPRAGRGGCRAGRGTARRPSRSTQRRQRGRRAVARAPGGREVTGARSPAGRPHPRGRRRRQAASRRAAAASRAGVHPHRGRTARPPRCHRRRRPRARLDDATSSRVRCHPRGAPPRSGRSRRGSRTSAPPARRRGRRSG